MRWQDQSRREVPRLRRHNAGAVLPTASRLLLAVRDVGEEAVTVPCAECGSDTPETVADALDAGLEGHNCMIWREEVGRCLTCHEARFYGSAKVPKGQMRLQW